MIKLYDKGVYLIDGAEILEDAPDALLSISQKTGNNIEKILPNLIQWHIRY